MFFDIFLYVKSQLHFTNFDFLRTIFPKFYIPQGIIIPCMWQFETYHWSNSSKSTREIDEAQLFELEKTVFKNTVLSDDDKPIRG